MGFEAYELERTCVSWVVPHLHGLWFFNAVREFGTKGEAFHCW